MTLEDKIKDYRSRIDEAKQFIQKYGIAPGIAYMLGLETGSEEFKIWVMAYLEWDAERKGGKL